MNDPFDCLRILDRPYSDSELDSFKGFAELSPFLKRYVDVSNDVLREHLNDIRRQHIRRWAFCALSESPDNILMWSHYANAHRGIVIGYEFENLGNRMTFQKVKYQDYLDEFNWLEFGRFMDGEEGFGSKILEDLSLKLKEWEYEKEWRIWANGEGYYYYSKNEIKEVYFGINCQKDTKMLVARIMELPEDVKIYEMDTRRKPFRLVAD
ncbi:MAG: DUF2971 domain-containing protein [Imperialibacter sp.]|uniref:DUF2971 domain-containing protein n=1 Tax=Imperialibacter sp. TaxID=2038411 RepID=UPI0032EC78D8